MVNTALEMWTSQWGHKLQEHVVGGCAVDMARPWAATGQPERVGVDVMVVCKVASIVSIHPFPAAGLSIHSLPAAGVRPN